MMACKNGHFDIVFNIWWSMVQRLTSEISSIQLP
jgi:hypothetical protein